MLLTLAVPIPKWKAATYCDCFSSNERTNGRDPVGRSIVLAGRGRTSCGHQNQRPSSAATEGVMNARTTNVSNKSPKPIVVPS